MCLTINRGAGGLTFATCSSLAAYVQSLYSAGVTYSVPFSCSTFTATTATVCATASSTQSAATFFTNFNNNLAAFEQLSTQYSLVCANYGANQYDDSASVTTCSAAATLFVPCAQIVVPFPFCACVYTPLSTPFSFSTAVSESAYGLVAGKAANLYTFTIVIGSGFGQGASETTADKAEFYIDQSMRSMVLGSTFNGVFQPPSWGSITTQPDSFKVQFGANGVAVAVARGAQVGIIVDATTTLGQLSSAFTTQLYYNIFSADLKYCPRGFAYPPN